MPIKKTTEQINNQIDNSSLQSQKETSNELNEFIPRIRFNENDKKNLEKYFSNKGLNLSSGVRMILKEFMNENNL